MRRTAEPGGPSNLLCVDTRSAMSKDPQPATHKHLSCEHPLTRRMACLQGIPSGAGVCSGMFMCIGSICVGGSTGIIMGVCVELYPGYTMGDRSV